MSIDGNNDELYGGAGDWSVESNSDIDDLNTTSCENSDVGIASMDSEDVFVHSPESLAVLERLGAFRPYLKAIARAELPESLQSRVDDSDIVQETLLLACRSMPAEPMMEGEQRAWLRQILRNRVADVIRFHLRQRRDVRKDVHAVSFPAIKDSPSSQVRHSESIEQVRSALESLSPDDRTVLLLRQQHGLSFSEIGEQMGRSADAARMLWGRAILRLLKLVERVEEPDAGHGRIDP